MYHNEFQRNNSRSKYNLHVSEERRSRKVKMDRVIVIGMNFSPEITGIGKYTGEFCDYLSSVNYDVQVITSYPYYPQWKCEHGYNSKWYKMESTSGIKILRCPIYIPNPKKKSRRIFQELSFFLTSLLAVTFLLFKKNKADLIFVVSPSLLSGLVGLWYKFWHPAATMVYHIQDLQIDAASHLGIFKNRQLILLLGKIEKFILSKSDIISTISAGMMKRISDKSKRIKKLILFPNWVNIHEIYPAPPDRKFLRRHNLPLNKQIILYSGAVGEKQGLEMIIHAAPKIAKQLENILFVVCGSGPYFETLKKRSVGLGLSNIEFRPLLPVYEYNQLLNAAWLHLVLQKESAADLVMPSKLSAIMASGGTCLVTANENTCLYDLINNNNLGWAIRPGNVESLTQAICQLAMDPKMLEIKKSNALHYSTVYLSRDKVIGNFLSSVHEEKIAIHNLIIQPNN